MPAGLDNLKHVVVLMMTDENTPNHRIEQGKAEYWLRRFELTNPAD
jgi:hypothetical protein